METAIEYRADRRKGERVETMGHEKFDRLSAALINATQHPDNTDPAEINTAVGDIGILFHDLEQRMEIKSQLIDALECSLERLQSQVDRMGR